MKKLPTGIQDFVRLREEGFLYVDKTKLLYQLVTEGVYYFLSRPRRFGKSLLVSTLSELFQGKRELFQGLWIEDQWDWNVQYPVIRLGLSSIGHREIGLERALQLQLERIADSYGLKLKMEANSLRLRELIERLAAQAESGKVVVLIDEYDKPVLDYLHDIPQAEKHRDLLKSFYSVLKDADPYLRLVLLTGVSKFSRVSIFSELNNLTDLTIYSDYATMLGYTQEELEHYFADRITAMAPTPSEREELLDNMKVWYNGYSWDAKNFVYNPFSILSFFSKREFENFWFETGTPTFLVKLLKREQQYDFDQVLASATALGSFELDRIHPITLLFQTGYLTIRSKDEDLTYTLAYPNREVRYSLLQHLLGEYVEESPSDTYVQAKQMKDALKKEDVEAFVEGLNSLFASIPYQIFIANKEAYRRATPYHSVTFLALSLMGSFIQVEVSQAKGRPDAVVHTEQVIYVMEFKLNESAEAAMEQIKKDNYLQPYLNLGKAVKAVGFNFNAEQKALDQWLEEAVG